MSENLTINKLWNGSYILMLLLNVLTFTGFMMVNPVLAPYAISIGATLKFASVIAGIFALMALFARPLAGLAVDRINKKHLLHVSVALLMVTTLSYALAPTYQSLLLVRILHGLFFAISSTAGTSLATAYIPRNKLGQGIGYLGITYILGSGLGPNLGVLISEQVNYQAAFYAATGLLALATILMFFLDSKPAAPHAATGLKRSIRLHDLIAPELLFLSLLTACFAFLNGLIGNYILLLAEERSIVNVSFFFTVSTVILLVIRPTTGYLMDKKSLKFILVPAFAMATTAAVLLSQAMSLTMVLIAAVFYAVGQGSGTPAIQTTSIRRMGPARVGVATSTYFIGMDVGQGLGAIMGGYAAAILGSFSYVFLGAAAVLLIGLAAFLLNRREKALAK